MADSKGENRVSVSSPDECTVLTPHLQGSACGLSMSWLLPLSMSLNILVLMHDSTVSSVPKEEPTPAALEDRVADKLANTPLAGLQAPAEAHAALREQVHPVAARQQLRGRLHGRLLQALAPLYGQRLAVQEELAACRPALRRPQEPTSPSLCREMR